MDCVINGIRSEFSFDSAPGKYCSARQSIIQRSTMQTPIMIHKWISPSP
jgi:hypothetical protein